MLNSSFMEGREKVVELPGKKINDVLEFFSFLIKPKIINGNKSNCIIVIINLPHIVTQIFLVINPLSAGAFFWAFFQKISKI